MKRIIILFLLFTVSVSFFWGCQKRDFISNQDEEVQLAELESWYNRQLMPSRNPQSFAKLNSPDWKNTVVRNENDTIFYTTLILSKGSVNRELHAIFVDGSYQGLVRQYDFSSSDSLLVGTFTINGRFIDLGYYNKAKRYTQLSRAGNRNIVLMGTEMGGTLPEVPVNPPKNPTNPGGGEPNPDPNPTDPGTKPPEPTFPEGGGPISEGGDSGDNDGPVKTKIECGADNEEFVNLVNTVLDEIYDGRFMNENVNSCFTKTLLNSIRSKQKTALKICLNETTGTSGTYSNGTIGFMVPDFISHEVFFHELIHYYQDIGSFYNNFNSMGKKRVTLPNGQVEIVNSPGFANIEFETQLMLDLLRGEGSGVLGQMDRTLFDASEWTQFSNEYEAWIGSFYDINKKIIGASSFSQPNFLIDYNHFLKFYGTKSKHYKSEVIEFLPPQALINIMSSPNVNCL